jgi:hypothetical protein
MEDSFYDGGVKIRSEKEMKEKKRDGAVEDIIVVVIIIISLRLDSKKMILGSH